MNSFRQECPSCTRTLELPETAIGKLAKCPACEATFTAGQKSPVPIAPVTTSPVADSPFADSGGPRTTKAPASADPLRAPLPAGTANPAPLNPYAPSRSSTPVAEAGPLQVVERSFDDIFSPTLPIFGERWIPLIVAFLFVIAVWAVGGIVGLVAVGVAEGVSAGAGVLLAIFVLFPGAGLLTAYTSVGMARSAVAVARNSPSPLSELFPPILVVVRFIIGGLILGIVPTIGFFFFAALIGVVASGGAGGEEIAVSLSIVGFGIGILLVMVAYWLLWSWMFVVSDGRTSAIGAIQVAIAITMQNKLTSLLLIIIATALSTAGSAACYVGILVTQPITNLMFAVAYLMMTNQPISDPRAYRQNFVAPPSNQPSF